MKKLLVASALILCLVLCVFVFASCGKKTETAGTTAAPGTTPAGTTAAGTTAPATTAEATTAEPTTAAHVHTPETEYTIDVPATCKAAGSKSYHCEECGDIIEGTSVEIPADPDAHVVNDWTVTKKASVLGDGSKEGTCTVCSAPVVKEIEFKAEVWASDVRESDFKIKRHLLDALDGEHFYPTDENPNGKDYYFEVELLWNETITTKWVDNNGFRIELVNADSTRDNLFLLVPKNNIWGASDAKASGGFDYGWAAKHTIVYGPMGVNGTGTNAENFPNIGGYGWHRIGVKVHQEAAINGDGVTYSMVTTLYVDGAKVWQINFVEEGTKNFSKWVEKKIMLFTATNENGTIVYGDPEFDLCLDMSAWKSMEAPGVYVIHGLVTSAAVDPDFAPSYVPVADPAEATFSPEEGVEFPAKVFFTEPCETHVWDGETSVAREATLLENGEKIELCSVCGASRRVATEFVPKVYNPADLSNYEGDKSMLLLTKTLPQIAGEDHFYPTDETPAGKAVYFEFALLYNETMANSATDEFDMCLNYQGAGGKTLYVFVTKDNGSGWCKYAGGFDYANKKAILYGPEGGNAQPKENYPNMGNYGWHMIGVKFYQTAALEGDDVVYSGVSTLYVDGNKVWELDVDMSKFVLSSSKTLRLFDATNNAGVLTYSDNPNAAKVRMQLRGEGINGSSAPMYFVYGQETWKIVSADFAPAYEPVADPTASTFDLSNTITVPAAIYFKAK